MPSTSIDWGIVRTEYESGGEANSLRQLEKRHNVSRMTIARRAEREQWQRPPGAERVEPRPAVAEPAAEKRPAPAAAPSAALSGTLEPVNVRDDAAHRQALLKRHRDEWNGARDRVYAGLKKHAAAVTGDERRAAFDILKAGKISAEALAIIQANERRAWSIGTDEVPLTGARIVRVIFGDPYAEPNGNSSAAAIARTASANGAD